MKKYKSPNITLQKHQALVEMIMLEKRGHLAVHDTGTGKTFSAAAAAASLMLHHGITHSVIVVNKSAIKQWKEQFLIYWPECPLNRIFLTTVQKVDRIMEKILQDKKAKIFLTIDEVHNYVNPNAHTTELLIDWNQEAQVKKTLLLTATAFVNSSEDFISYAALIHGKSWDKVERNFSLEKARKWFYHYVSVYLIDKNKNPHYPTVVKHEVSLKMTPDTYKLYDQRSKHPKAFYTDLRELSLRKSKFCEKCSWIQKHVPEWHKKGEKTVIYTSYIERGSHILQYLLGQKNIDTIVIDGASTPSFRQQVIKRFNHVHTKQQFPSMKELVNEQIQGERCGDDNVWLIRKKENHYIHHFLFPTFSKKALSN